MSQVRTPSRRGKPPAATTRTAEHALLGLLATSETGVHGYDLMRQVADGPLTEIIRIEPGMLYHHLKSMANRDLLNTKVERQATRPDRQIHSITESGRAALEEWLSQPVRATRELRMEFLVKLYFARRANTSVLENLVRGQREVIEALLESLRAQRDELKADDPDLEFQQQVCDLRIAQNQAALEWLRTLR